MTAINYPIQGRVKLEPRTIASVPIPPSGTVTLFVDSVTNDLCQIDSAGVVTNFGNYALYGAKTSELGSAAYADIGQTVPYSETTLTVTTPTTSKLFTVVDANATTLAKITAFVQGKSNSIADELEFEPVMVNANCTTDGTINFILSCHVFFSGSYIINYSIGY